MLKKIKLYRHKLLLFMFVFFLQSCSNITTLYQTKKLYYGQSSGDIVKKLGNPSEKKIINMSSEIYVYYVHSSIFDLFLNSEKFPYIGFYPFNRTGKEFWVVLNNGKLKTSGYVKDFGKYSNNIILN